MKKVFNVFICFGFVFLLLCNAGNNCFATNAVCNRTSIKVNKNKGTVEDLIHNNKKIKLDENFYKWTLSKFSNANAKITKIKLKDLQIS
jgi:hypothetical protein